MIRNALLALALAGVASPVTPATLPAPASPVVQVQCLTGMGSAFRVSPHVALSVKHVTSLGGCFIEGPPLDVRYTSPTQDFAIIATKESGPFLTVDCNGFVEGRKYLARGYARGLPFETTIEVIATGKSDSGFAVLWGIFTFIPGQSGGAVIDKVTGKVVGTINVYNAAAGRSGSVELKGTPICAGAAR